MYSSDKDILNAIELVEGHIAKNEFDRTYPFTTENISGYIDLFDLKDKSLLTVGSSGDQAINAFFKGATDVTIFDINPFFKYYYFLKVAALNCLEKEEFLDFLKHYGRPTTFKRNYKAFNIESYNKLKSELRILDYESYLFWDEFFYSYNPIDVRLNLFNDDEERTEVEREFNLYLRDDDSYKLTRDILQKNVPTFINGDIKNINIDRKFDNIWLSNLARIFYKYKDIKKAVDDTYNLLNDNGMLLVSYLYNYREHEKYKNDWYRIYNYKRVLKMLEDYNVGIEDFLGERGIKSRLANYPEHFYKSETDAIILCKKK